MLNGKAALLVFTFYLDALKSITDSLEGLPFGESAAAFLGVPVPIYLDENLTGIVIETESRAMDIESSANQTNKGEETLLKQRGVGNEVTVNLVAESTNVILNVLLTLFDQVFPLLQAQNYSLTYFNGPTTIIGGRLMGVSVTRSETDNLLRIGIRISKVSKPLVLPNATKDASRGLIPGVS